MARRHAAGAVLTLALASLVSCERSTGNAAEKESVAAAPSSHVERGPVGLVTRLDRPSVTVGEKLTLSIDVTAPEGVRLRLPEIDESLGTFAVRTRRTPPDIPDGATRRWAHQYVLDTFVAGAQEIPAVTIEFEDARPETVAANGEPITGELASEPLRVMVASVLEGDADEADFRDIKAEVDVPVRPSFVTPARTLGTTFVVLTLAALLAWWWIRRSGGRSASAIAPPLPPHAWAKRELEKLAGAELVERGQFAEFYYRLSGIVREYIERRFGLMAPERTTDEFLREAERDASLESHHRDHLATFLRAADLVKFARHEPTAAEADAALGRAREFIDETAPAPAEPDAARSTREEAA